MPYAHLQTRIHKFVLEHRKQSVIEMAPGTKILSAKSQPNEEDLTEVRAVLWAEVPPDSGLDSEVPVTVYMIPTGAPIPKKPMTYVDTVQLPKRRGGMAVFHVYVDSQAPVSVVR